ncbi:T9SS type A sorting domain-containing protein [Constantimarinum furrinae]|uniref:Secretion system C-terminal sorting domain-containing protein n=1 Tax=Constantimarinum furrinae TaxID=2562285 RepID=A0A7G8PS33_9FLAO|nr:T9SS type A sorting domain-containing protein [Constantimarinum furrinae]QNJ97149.1 hypothetical protein ALE3EI_0569 [Constantimarinum furrinae]
MRTFFTFALSLIGIFTLNAQDPAIQWQNTIGGSDGDFMQSMEPTSDGGYVISGFSFSNTSGDKTENSNGGIDMWIVKVDSDGQIEWQNTIGGSGDDYASVVQQTLDGGYIVLAGSDSNISGDKTENSRGGLDFWILKLNSSGSIVWQKTYGGDQPDFDTFGQQTSDGGYIVGGYSDSGISGDKTVPSNGQRDYWIMKLDALGNIVWQKGIGGSLVDRVEATFQTTDGGYMIGGYSNSPVSGDKTEPSLGSSDYWVVKLDANGNMQWQNTIGGNDLDLLRDMIQTADGGYLIGGYSKSNISGDKTENSQGDFDYWMVKLDSNGTISWQNTIGGSGIDYPRDIKQLANGHYVVAGWSNSNVSGDKAEASNGGYDYWLIKLNASGTLISQNSIGGTGDESGPYIQPLANGDFVMGCSSDSNISGDKGDNNEGMDDYWIFKVSPTILEVKDVSVLVGISAFPNPTSEMITLKLDKNYPEILVQVANILGETISSEKIINSDTTEITIDGSSGIYLVSVFTSEGTTATLKVLKQ